jgi:hypothetical protein
VRFSLFFVLSASPQFIIVIVSNHNPIMVFEKYDLWRNHPAIVGRPRHMFPGLGLAAGIFAVYLAADYAYDKYMGGDKHHHGDGHHGDAHHGEAKPAHH